MTVSGAVRLVVVQTLVWLKAPRESRGGSLDTLQAGRGMPAPPQPQAFARSPGRSE
jgi:hypothetical protein